MSNKFITFLGTNEYEQCTYKLYSEVYTRFVQEAIVLDLCKGWDDQDKIIVFVTDKAKEKNWLNGFYGNKEKAYICGLKEILKKITNIDGYNFKIEEKNIPEGKNTGEIWDIFESIIQCIDDNDSIIFDMTHSFRTIPMLAIVAFNYAKVVKSINIKGIYYGAYEARFKTGNGQEITPIFDVTEFDKLLEWAFAVNSFLKLGNCKNLTNVVKEQLNEDLIKKDKQAIDIREFINSLNRFSNTILTCRGRYIDDINIETSVRASYKDLCNKMDVIKQCVYPSQKTNNCMKAIIPLLNKIEQRTQDFRNADDLHTTIAYIRWCIDNSLIQQAYTALDEGIVTYVCIKLGCDYRDSCVREKVTKAIRSKEREKLPNKKITQEEDLSYILEDINFKNIDEELFNLSIKTRQTRNDINHFGFINVSSVSKASTLEIKIQNLFNKFLDIINKT